jgi:hypothetical protein
LGEAGHDVEEEPARRRLGVDPVRQAPEMDVAGFEGIDQIHEPFDAPPEPIQLPDDQRVAATQVRKRIIETGASQPSAAGLIREDAITAGLLKGIELQG